MPILIWKYVLNVKQFGSVMTEEPIKNQQIDLSKQNCLNTVDYKMNSKIYMQWLERSWQTQVAFGEPTFKKLFEMLRKFMNRNYFHITSMFTFYFVLFLRWPYIICFCDYLAHHSMIVCMCLSHITLQVDWVPVQKNWLIVIIFR